MSSRVAGAGLALIAAALLAVSMAAPAVLPGLSLFAGHPTVRDHTRETQTVYVGLYGAQLCNTGGDGTCTSGSPRPAFRIAAYGELGATGLLVFSASVLAILTLAKSERRKGAGKLVRIASLPVMAGAAALALLGPFDEAAVPIGLGVGLLGGGIVSALVASVVAVRPPPPIKLRVAAGGAPSMPRSPQSSAAIPASQPFDMAIFDADLRSAEPRMRRDSRPRPLASGSVPAPSQSTDGFAPPAQIQGPLFSSAPQLRPLYEAMPSQGGTGGLMPIERPVIPSRAPTPIPRDDLSAFTGIPSRPEVAPEPRIEPPFAPPPPAPIAPAIEAPIEPGAPLPRDHAPSLPPPAPRSKAPSVPPPTPRSRPASMAPPPPASPNTQVSLVPPMPDHELAPHRSDAWAVITDAPRPEPHQFPRAETPLAPPPPPVAAHPETPIEPPPPVAATAAPMLPAPAPSASALTVETAPLIPVPQPVAPPPAPRAAEVSPPPAPPATPPIKRSTLPPPRAQRPTNAPPQRPNDTARPPLRAAVPMPARPQRPTAPPVIPVVAPRRPAPTAPPPNLSNIPAIPALPKRIETEADDRGDSFDPAGLEPASTIPPELSDPAGHTDVSVSLPADTSPSGEPAAPAPTNPEVPEVPEVSDQARPARATAAASSPALPAILERPMPKLPISTAPDSLPPPRDEKQANGPSPACPQCEAPMAWVEEHLRFYCKSCRMYF